MTGYDLFALVVIVFSAMAGWVRGGAREIITFLSFILAALIALIALPVTGPVFRDIFNPDWVGTVLAAWSASWPSISASGWSERYSGDRCATAPCPALIARSGSPSARFGPWSCWAWFT
jgi:hypothetical protein